MIRFDQLLQVTRRRVLGGIAAGFVSILAACSGPLSERRETQPASLPPDGLAGGQPPGDPAATEAGTQDTGTAVPSIAAQQATATAQGTPRPTATPRPIPVFEPTPTLPEDAWPLVRTTYAVVTSRRLQTHWISLDQVHQLWNGGITDWSQLGEPRSVPVRHISYAGSTGPFDAARAELQAGSISELEELLRHEQGGLALIPTADVDFRVRTLRIDGLKPYQNPEGNYPIFIEERVNPATLPVGPELPPPPVVMMTWVGDIIFGRFVVRRLEAIGDFAASFRSIYPELIVADFTIGNLECSLSDNIPQPELEDPQTFLFKCWTDAIQGIQLAEFDVIGRANNHSFNFGVQGMDDTTVVLEQAGIKHFGMGHNVDAARQAAVIEWNGLTYALLGYNGISDSYDGAGPDWAGTCPMVDWMVVEDIQRELSRGHIVIPFFHWGVEYVADPTEQQRYFAQIAIDNGAAMVMGSHPHWVQAVETYQGKSIIYSLGNFVFDQSWSRETMEGTFADIWMQGDQVLEVDLVPILIEDDHRPRLMDPWEAQPVLDRIWGAADRIIDG